MGRKSDVCLKIFRGIQFVLSLLALGVGVWIAYEMFVLGETAQAVENGIQSLQDDPSLRASIVETLDISDSTAKSALDTLSTVLDPILHVLEETPWRAVIIAAVGLISLLEIAFLHWAHRSKKHPGANKRSVRVSLGFVMLILWLAAFVCAIMLAIEYGAIAVAGGVEIKVAWRTVEKVVVKVLEYIASKAAHSVTPIDRVLNLVDSLITIGELAIVSVLAAGICLIGGFVSAIVACCTKTRKDDQVWPSTPGRTPMMAQYDEKSPVSGVTQVHDPWPSPAMTANPYQHGSQGYNGRAVV